LRRSLIAIEILTATILGYLEFYLSWQSPVQVLIGLQLTFGVSACAIIALGAVRRRPWVPKAAICAAAFIGIPNISTVGQLAQLTHAAAGPAVVLSYCIALAAATLQLAAFLVGLRHLSSVAAV
jgi:hypothetical protein